MIQSQAVRIKIAAPARWPIDMWARRTDVMRQLATATDWDDPEICEIRDDILANLAFGDGMFTLSHPQESGVEWDPGEGWFNWYDEATRTVILTIFPADDDFEHVLPEGDVEGALAEEIFFVVFRWPESRSERVEEVVAAVALLPTGRSIVRIDERADLSDEAYPSLIELANV